MRNILHLFKLHYVTGLVSFTVPLYIQGHIDPYYYRKMWENSIQNSI